MLRTFRRGTAVTVRHSSSVLKSWWTAEQNNYCHFSDIKIRISRSPAKGSQARNVIYTTLTSLQHISSCDRKTLQSPNSIGGKMRPFAHVFDSVKIQLIVSGVAGRPASTTSKASQTFSSVLKWRNAISWGIKKIIQGDGKSTCENLLV